MQFQYLRQEHFRANHCMMLNRWVEVEGAELLLVALVSRDDNDSLYYMYRSLQNTQTPTDDVASWELPKTQRENLLNTRMHRNDPMNHTLSSLSLLGQTLTMESLSGSRFDTYNFQNLMALQYFFEHGIDLERWDEVDISMDTVILYECKLRERFSYVSSHIKPSDLIEITFDAYSINIPFPEVIKVPIDSRFNAPVVVEYVATDTLAVQKLYINAVKLYDVHDEANSPFKGEWLEGLPEEAISRMKVDFQKSSERLCPRGMALAILEYGTDENIQLEIFESSVLDAIIDYKERNNASGMVAAFRPDEPFGPQGYKNWTEVLKPIDPQKDERLYIELWGRIVWMPKVTYTSGNAPEVR